MKNEIKLIKKHLKKNPIEVDYQRITLLLFEIDEFSKETQMKKIDEKINENLKEAVINEIKKKGKIQIKQLRIKTKQRKMRIN